MESRKKMYLSFAGGFLMPPAVWLLLAWFTEIWNFNELMQILLSPNIWIYSTVYILGSLSILYSKIKTIDKLIKNPTKSSDKKITKIMNQLPAVFAINIIVYILVGPFVVLHGMTFLTNNEFWLAEAVGIPIIFLLAAPFYIYYLASIEHFAKNFSIRNYNSFYSIKGKMTMTLGFTNVGVIALIAVSAISIVNSHPDMATGEILSNLIIKSVIGAMFAFIVQFTNIYLIIRMVSKPIKNLDDTLDVMLKDIDKGVADLTINVERKTLDEIGTITLKFNSFVGSLKELVDKIKRNSLKLTSNFESLSETSSRLSSEAEEMKSQSSQVASASEQMDITMNTMAATSEEMSMNISSVANASVEMSQNFAVLTESVSNVSESMDVISQNASESFAISESAEELASKAISTMNILGQAADEIGTVTDMIKRVAEKTNLLALNATIEAASAGDAGKGFAVVAFEIKELANQSAEAAEDITKRIEGVQLNTQNTSEAISDLSNIVGKISTSSELINRSVKDQAIAMENVSKSIIEANKGINNISFSSKELSTGSNELSKNAQETAVGIGNITKNIAKINETLSDNKENTGKLSLAATDLNIISENLSTAVSSFKVEKNIHGENSSTSSSIINENIQEEIEKIKKIVKAHVAKGDSLNKMLNGGPVVYPMDSHECTFAKWYYHEALEHLVKLPEYKAIEEPHDIIHSLMNDIFNLYQSNLIDKAKVKMEEWENVSSMLLHATDDLINKIRMIKE